jgi:hypothetical protein
MRRQLVSGPTQGVGNELQAERRAADPDDEQVPEAVGARWANPTTRSCVFRMASAISGVGASSGSCRGRLVVEANENPTPHR